MPVAKKRARPELLPGGRPYVRFWTPEHSPDRTEDIEGCIKRARWGLTLVFRSTLLLLMLSSPCWAGAQEVKFIDLSSVRQRTELRHPPAPAVSCPEGASCTGSGWGGVGVGDGAPDWRDPHALGVWLVRVTPTDIDPLEPFEAEFQVRNTGAAAIEIPVSPHLSDLQPSDDSLAFTYLSLSLVVTGERASALGFVSLYGTQACKGSVLLLRPGDWIRVKANVKLQKWPQNRASVNLRGTFWLRRITFHPRPGGQFTEIQNLYPNATPTPPILVLLAPLERPDKPDRH